MYEVYETQSIDPKSLNRFISDLQEATYLSHEVVTDEDDTTTVFIYDLEPGDEILVRDLELKYGADQSVMFA
jgi:hypothetical protein